MAAIDLTTLADVKTWLGIADTSADALLARLITDASQFVCNLTGRTGFNLTTYADLYDGAGKAWLMLRQWPVAAVTAVAFAGDAPQGPSEGFPPSNGWLLEPPLPGGGNQRLTLVGYRFPPGRANVQVTYQAGYEIIPDDVASACIELVGEAYARKDRIGTVSKSLGGQETVAFSQKSMGDAVREKLASYIRTVPC